MTPKKNILFLPTRALKNFVVKEWELQHSIIKYDTMPITCLCNAAIDNVKLNRMSFINRLLNYAKFDSLCYWASEPQELVELQIKEWGSILKLISEALRIDFRTTTGFAQIDQSVDYMNIINSILSDLNEYELTGLVKLSETLGSLLLSIGLWKGIIDPSSAFSAAYLHEVFQESKWGSDEEVKERRKSIYDEVNYTFQFLGSVSKANVKSG